jgi:CubicO group peptidase (beta-lactamase class C family)
MLRPAILATLFVSLSHIAMAAPSAPAAAHIEQYLQAEMERLHIPGLAVAVIGEGKILYAKGLGYSNLEHKTPVGLDAVFQSASTGKQYTALAILQLVQAGKLGLDEPLRMYMPEAPPTWSGITLRQLLNHTAGLPPVLSQLNLQQEMSDAAMRKRIFAEKLLSEPGSKFSYSNLGYVLLGDLIAQVSGHSLGAYLRQHVFAPLGMQQSRLVDELALVPGRVSPYEWDGKQWKNVAWSAPVYNRGGDGALWLTLPDVARWDGALYGDALVPAPLLRQAFTPGKLNDGSLTSYGFGWSIRLINAQPVYEHSGVWQGYSAQISRYVNARLTVAMFANLDGAPLDRLTHHVAGLWNPTLMPPAPTVLADHEPDVTAMLTERIKQLAQGTLPADALSAEFAATFVPDQAKEYQAMLAPLGPLADLSLSKRRDDGAIRVYIYRLAMGTTRLLCQLRLTADGKIALLAFRPE